VRLADGSRYCAFLELAMVPRGAHASETGAGLAGRRDTHQLAADVRHIAWAGTHVAVGLRRTFGASFAVACKHAPLASVIFSAIVVKAVCGVAAVAGIRKVTADRGVTPPRRLRKVWPAFVWNCQCMERCM
jgi:hypothetical protein